MPRNRSRFADIFTLLARDHTRAFKTHIRNPHAPPRIALYYNSSLFPSHFLFFLFLFGRSCGRQNLSYSSIYRNTSFFVRTPRQTRSLAVLTRIIAPLCGDIPPLRAFRVLFARLLPSPRQLLPPNCRSTPRPDSFDSLYSRKRCRGAHFIMFSFHVEHTSCHSPKPQHLSRFSLVYAYLYIASLHVFRLCVCFFRPLRFFPRCRSAADDRASAPLRRFCFQAPHRRPGLQFSSALVCIPFFRGRTPSFFDFSISFCLMLHGAPQTFCLFFSAFGFSLPSAFRAFPSRIRSASSSVFD